MPTPARELKVTYGTTVLGTGSSTYYIDAPIRLASTPDKATVECDVIVVGTSESAFRSNCVALETAFKNPRQFLEVKFGSAVHETFDPTIYTGFNAVPSITKIGAPEDTGRSRRYRVAVAVDLPADAYANQSDASTTNARRQATINLYTTDAGRRRLILTGAYTASATSGRGAREQYNANITTYVTSLLTGFGGTWEGPFDPQVVTDDQNTLCNFSFVYEELIFNQSQSTLDDATLRRQRMTITRSTETPGDSTLFGVRPQRLQRVMIDYSVAVDKAQSQDLDNVWASKVKPYLTQLAQQVADNHSGFIESELPSYDFVENRISARLVFVSAPSGSLISCRITTDESESTGVVLVPVWGKTRDRLRKRRFIGPGALTRTITIVLTEVGLPGSTSIAGSGGALDVIGGNNPPGGSAGSDVDDLSLSGLDNPDGFALAGGVPEPESSPDGGQLKRTTLGIVKSATPRRIGPAGGQGLDVVDRVIVGRYEYFVDAEDN